MQIHFAPIQGQTDYVYRNAHHTLIGGVDCYYTPFVRWEHGGIRKKDLRDINPQNNKDITLVPQIIAKDRDEMCQLCDIIQELGWKKIDINMGCPFPLQTHAGRGAGLLANTDKIEYICREIENRKEVSFSIKMRIGMTSTDEGVRIIPLLNETPIKQLTIHPRLGIDQYKSKIDYSTFVQFYHQIQIPLIYNGDIKSSNDIQSIEHSYPNLRGVMIGRALLAQPMLAKAYKEQREFDEKEQLSSILKIHDTIYGFAITQLQGDAQILSKLQEFWQPLENSIDKKIFKKLTKCSTLRNYNETLINLK